MSSVVAEKQQCSLLHLAAESGHVGVAELLIQAGAQMDSRNKYCDTPLHMAAESGNMGVAELLLNAGALVDSKNKYGVTPFRMAILREHYGIAEFLKPGTLVDDKDGKAPKSHSEITPEEVSSLSQQLIKSLNIGAEGGDSLSIGAEGGDSLSIGAEGGDSLNIGAEGGDSLSIGAEGGDSLSIGAEGGDSLSIGAEGGDSLSIGAEGGDSLSIGAEGGDNLSIGAEGGDSLSIGAEGGDNLSIGAEGGDNISIGAEGGDNLSIGAEGGDNLSIGAEGGDNLSIGAEGGDSLSIGAEGGDSLSIGAEGGDNLSIGAEGGDSLSIGAEGGDSLSIGAEGGDNLSIGAEGGDSLNIGAEGGDNLSIGAEGGDSLSIGAEGGELQTTSCIVSVPPGAVTMQTVITCRIIDPNDVTLSLRDGDMLVSDIIELGPQGTTFLKPVTVRLPYNSTLSGDTREPVIWVTEDMSQWRELKTTRKSKEHITVTVDHFAIFAVISQLKRDHFSVSTKGVTVTSSTQPTVIITIPEQSVSTPIQVKLQVQEISKEVLEDMKARDQSSHSLVCTSPIVKIEAADQLTVHFNKPVTVQVPHPRHYMEVPQGGATELRVTSSEEGTDQWTDVTDDVNIRDLGEFVEFNVTEASSHIILDMQAGGKSEEIGPIPLALCNWIHQHDAQFMLMQREDNQNQFLIECCKVSDTDDKETRAGYKAPVPSKIVRLCEGQKVGINIEGNVSFAQFGKADKQITFHSQIKHNLLHITVRGEKEGKGKTDLDGEGFVTFYALPRVSVGVNAHGKKVCSVLRKEQEPEEQPSSIFLCELSIKVLPARQMEDHLQVLTFFYIGSNEKKNYYRRMADYIYFIKEKASTDWMDLAHFLGFSWTDIQNIAELNRDNKKSCWHMLGKWKRKKGNFATIDLLMKALKQAGLQSVLDGLKEKFPETTVKEAPVAEK
ncbi:ankyrin-3-like [Branchiostoma floridae]|uniref:Ankyrin-3-like n=1 Tax=Branchiostoma floridae TaxID=7739 RepID=A0A9J7HJ45_BRAFL|nr:ankyrin-3-like [Branchiostoma floridae]